MRIVPIFPISPFFLLIMAPFVLVWWTVIIAVSLLGWVIRQGARA
jgi:hypothetical protein